MKRTFVLAGILAAFVVGLRPAAACSLCEGSGLATSLTLRQEAALSMARVVLHGTIANPTFDQEGKGGRTDFLVKAAFREDKEVKTPEKLVLSRYLPVEDAKKPPHYLLFCDVDGKRLDPYRGVPLRGGQKSADYVKKALAMDAKKPAENLAFFFAHLDDADPEVSRDAFLEFARASDADVLKAAAKLDRTKLREWMKDDKTPSIRVSVYALLLGACGKDEDAKYLRELLDSTDERIVAAADGILAGYVQMKPAEGWKLTRAILADGKKPLLTRISVMRTLRFYHSAQPKESRPHVLAAMRAVLEQGELADIAVEDLRRWQTWDLTDEIVKRYGQKGFESPLMKRAIVRYALCCEPTAASKDFLTLRRQKERDVVEEVEEGLRLEKR